jgi:tyrosine-protein phosphatase SIW14
MNTALRVLLLVLSVSPLLPGADAQQQLHVRNFGAVNEHLYRGGQPLPEDIQELAAHGVKLVIDLREVGEATGIEKEQVQKLGMRYVNVPMRPIGAPTQAEIQRSLALILQNDSQRVFVHCRRGKDRTGTVIACYRIQHDGWKNEKALDEAKNYGLSRVERGMRAFIAHFTPVTLQPAGALGN